MDLRLRGHRCIAVLGLLSASRGRERRAAACHHSAVSPAADARAAARDRASARALSALVAVLLSGGHSPYEPEPESGGAGKAREGAQTAHWAYRLIRRVPDRHTARVRLCAARGVRARDARRLGLRRAQHLAARDIQSDPAASLRLRERWPPAAIAKVLRADEQRGPQPREGVGRDGPPARGRAQAGRRAGHHTSDLSSRQPAANGAQGAQLCALRPPDRRVHVLDGADGVSTNVPGLHLQPARRSIIQSTV